MMEYYFQRQYFFLFFFLLCSGFLSSSSACYNFSADGKHGWELNESANIQWAGEYRFLINDTIVFNYTNGSDSVLVVKKGDYDNCSKTNPEKMLVYGKKFTFNRHGPFYFISGKEDNCKNGQRLIVVVLSPRNPRQNPTPSPPSPWAINPAILLVGSASLLLLILLISKKKKKSK